jgi:hypothetical protein
MTLELGLFRAIHIVSVVVWLGGVGFVTTTLLPVIRRDWPEDEQSEIFARFARRFAGQARATVGLAGLSGLWLAYRLGYLSRRGFELPWWLVAMALVWAAFSAMLYLRPALTAALSRLTARKPRTLASVELVHRFLLAASLFTIAAAIVGVHA